MSRTPTSSWNCCPDHGTGRVCPTASGSGRPGSRRTDPDKTFRVGLIYGPSGCGKSSLVKAGLLPRLAKHVLPVYVEATPEETETRLLKGIAEGVSRSAAGTGAGRFPGGVRQGRVLRSGQKVLLVLDQFEQWLHAKRGEENTELVAALRQCDGEHLQAVVMVRDDFWMAATRFMDGPGDRTGPGSEHRRRRSLRPSPCPQGADGIRDRLRELARSGRATSPRTSTPFWIKRSPSLPRTARSSRCGWPCSPRWSRASPGPRRPCGRSAAPRAWASPSWKRRSVPRKPIPKHRLHQKAAQAVLKALLPETGTDIKGQMRSEGGTAGGIRLCRPPPGLRRPDPHPRRRASPDHAHRPGGFRRRADRPLHRAGATTNSPTTTSSTPCGTG